MLEQEQNYKFVNMLKACFKFNPEERSSAEEVL